MQRAKNCTHFEMLGSDLKEARRVMGMGRKELPNGYILIHGILPILKIVAVCQACRVL